MTNQVSELSDIMLIRLWQHKLNEMLKKKEFKIPVHLAFGHEASAVALDRSMQPDDLLCLTHRNVAYNLARCKSLVELLKHYSLSYSSISGAFMGSMNLAIDGSGIAYTSSILGNNLGVAAGFAMNRTLTHKPGVIFVLSGDGAIEEGSFWEALIFAKSHNLPLVFVVENNDFSLSSSISQRRCQINLGSICAGIGVQYLLSNGASLNECKKAFMIARDLAVNDNPVCIELNISTFCQHAGPTPGWPQDPLSIDIKNGLIIENNPEDPVYLVREILGDLAYNELSEKLFNNDNA